MSNLSLIRSWHEKAKEDYFSRFVFEYMALEAFLKKYKYTEDVIYSLANNRKERSYIQAFKNDTGYAKQWSDLVSRDQYLQNKVAELIDFLNNEPLDVDTNWWGCSAYNHNQCSVQMVSGTLQNENDFMNIVEFWYQVRNNLFHAGKNPDSKRDEQLVTFAYNTLSVFLEEVLIKEMEQRTMVPASWEDFDHKFFRGEAEAQITINGRTACSNVYELLFVEDSYLPVLFRGNLIDREYIIERLSFELMNIYGDPYLLIEMWNKLKSYATTDEQKNNLKRYFSELIPFFESEIEDFSI